jgi:hypothetical protein
MHNAFYVNPLHYLGHEIIYHIIEHFTEEVLMNTIRNTLVEVAYSVIPITAIIFIIQIALKLPYEELVRFVGGAILVFIGLVLFLLGTKIGIVPIGERIGEYLPQTGKLIVVLIFGTLLGFAVTVAEPNVQVLATQVDLASDGAIPKTVLVMSVGIGVAIFIALALIRLVKGKHINYFLLPSYALVLLLALFTPEHYVPIAIDAGGVVTGPLVVPFIMALGVGIASAFSGKRDSFGLVGLIALGPILAVLILGVLYN